MTALTKHYRIVRKLIKKDAHPGPFAGKFRFSPYMACGHGCRYCDGRHEKYHVEGDFDRDIVIRQNAPELLAVELPRIREKGPVCIASGVSDPYQPVEREEGLMRRCAEVFAEHEHPATVQTKSALIRRDIDLWEKVHRRSAFNLWVSLTFADDQLRQIFEPHAGSVAERMDVLREFKQRGMHVGVLAMPFIPFVSDGEEQMTDLLRELSAIGVEFVMPGLLTLKRGRQYQAFMDTIDRDLPHRRASFDELYRGVGPYGEPDATYARSFGGKISRLLEGFALPDRQPHRCYRGQFARYDEIQILLGDMLHLYRHRGRNTSRLSGARRRYHSWLDGRRRHYSRKRSLSFSQLEEELLVLARTGELADLLGNARLGEFISAVLLEEKVFDYQRLELIDSP